MIDKISWELKVCAPDATEPMILRRDTMSRQVQAAASLCADALTKHFGLSKVSSRGIDERLQGTRAVLVSGSETDYEQHTELPVGEVLSNIVDIKTGQPVAFTTKKVDVRVSIEGISEEASNLAEAAKVFTDDKGDSGISEPTLEILTGLIDDRQLLVDAATQVATARRLLKYVILPKGSLDTKQEKTLGFDTWFQEQITRYGQKPTKKMREAVRDKYFSEGLALKNLRRTAWSPIFFKNLGIDSNEVIFYMTYREILSKNCGHTVTFSSFLNTIIPHTEASAALESIFSTSDDHKPPELKTVS